MSPRLLHKLVYYSKAGELYKLFSSSSGCLVLVYHRISPINHDNFILKDLSVSPEIFERQMKYIKARYRLLPLEELVQGLKNNPGKMREVIAVTFDDAYLDNYQYAFPVLKKYGIPGAIFVPTGFIETGSIFWWSKLIRMLSDTGKNLVRFSYSGKDFVLGLNNENAIKSSFHVLGNLFKRAGDLEKDRLFNLLSDVLEVRQSDIAPETLTWSQIKEMSENNIIFGAHSHSHRALFSLSDTQVKEELCRPKEILEDRLNVKITTFAYPYGERNNFDSNTIHLVAEAGYNAAFTMIQGKITLKNTDLFLLPRIGIGGHDTEESFKLKLSGLLPFFHN